MREEDDLKVLREDEDEVLEAGRERQQYSKQKADVTGFAHGREKGEEGGRAKGDSTIYV